MKRIIALTLILTTTFSYPCHAKPQYSEATKKLMQEAGQVIDYDVDEVMSRQEARRQAQANKSTPTTQNGQNGASRTLKTANDEYRIFADSGQSVKVTDTSDELHIYSNEYGQDRSYGAKNSWDEFHTAPYDISANDGYEDSTWGELHINENYRQNVYYEPEKDRNRLGIDEYRLPWQMN